MYLNLAFLGQNQEFDDWLEGIFGEKNKPSGDDDNIDDQ